MIIQGVPQNMKHTVKLWASTKGLLKEVLGDSLYDTILCSHYFIFSLGYLGAVLDSGSELQIVIGQF